MYVIWFKKLPDERETSELWWTSKLMKILGIISLQIVRDMKQWSKWILFPLKWWIFTEKDYFSSWRVFHFIFCPILWIDISFVCSFPPPSLPPSLKWSNTNDLWVTTRMNMLWIDWAKVRSCRDFSVLLTKKQDSLFIRSFCLFISFVDIVGLFSKQYSFAKACATVLILNWSIHCVTETLFT